MNPCLSSDCVPRTTSKFLRTLQEIFANSTEYMFVQRSRAGFDDAVNSYHGKIQPLLIVKSHDVTARGWGREAWVCDNCPMIRRSNSIGQFYGPWLIRKSAFYHSTACVPRVLLASNSFYNSSCHLSWLWSLVCPIFQSSICLWNAFWTLLAGCGSATNTKPGEEAK